MLVTQTTAATRWRLIKIKVIKRMLMGESHNVSLFKEFNITTSLSTKAKTTIKSDY